MKYEYQPYQSFHQSFHQSGYFLTNLIAAGTGYFNIPCSLGNHTIFHMSNPDHTINQHTTHGGGVQPEL